MMTLDLDLQLKDTHDEVWDLLPWYVNGTLDDNEQNQVKAHLLSCRLCHEELERCQNMVTATHLGREQQWQQKPDQLDKLLGQIELRETHKAAQSGNFAGAILIHYHRLKNWLFDRYDQPNWTVAVPAAAALMFAAVFLFQFNADGLDQGDTQMYETLTSGNAAATSSAKRLQVIFAPNSTTADIVAALEPFNGRIIDGPTVRGRFTIAIESGFDADLSELASELRASKTIMFAQPEN